MENSWKSVTEESNKNGSDKFLRVKVDCKLKVRLIGKPVQVVKVFTDDRKCIVLDNEDVGKQLKDKHPDRIGNVSIRFACWCIDRDSKTLKILDMPKTVFRAMGRRIGLTGKSISGKEGCDFGITTNGQKGKLVRYEVVYIEETTLTEEEIEMVKKKRADGDSFDLAKVFASCSFEEAEDKLTDVA